MQQYTTTEQTAKLIELGFEKPKSISSIKVTGNIITTADDLIGEPPSVMGGKITANYSIGELIEMLPDYRIVGQSGFSIAECTSASMYYGRGELIDALYLLIVELKEEGVI